jgi:hypothetical protein
MSMIAVVIIAARNFASRALDDICLTGLLETFDLPRTSHLGRRLLLE